MLEKIHKCIFEDIFLILIGIIHHIELLTRFMHNRLQSLQLF